MKQKFMDVEFDCDFDVTNPVEVDSVLYELDDVEANNEYRDECADEKEKYLFSHVPKKALKNTKTKKTKFKG